MQIRVRHTPETDIEKILLENRNITKENDAFFLPDIEHLHNPFLLPDMKEAVERIFMARERNERVVIFGDYDVDGVSGTAILVRFLTEIGIQTSYRLPHRVHDGYGLKKYFFDELKEKNVALVITVDCGTRDIEAIEYAQSLGIDVIVTDHHAVPEIIPEGIPVVNPKRKDSQYPFMNLAGAGVAFKLIHALTSQLFPSEKEQQSILTKYIDLASLGTVSDCMPLVGENRVITTLGLKQMRNSASAGLRKFVEGNEKVEGNADIIGFQIGPRINASGRMDTPLTALRWLLASEDRCDEFLTEIEELNTERQNTVKDFSKKALENANPDDGILFFVEEGLEHGLIGLVAGKLTEAYNRPSIVLCYGKNEPENGNREYEQDTQNILPKRTLVASCRSPEWCNLIELLDGCKDFFVRYGGHRQAAGFTIEASRFDEFCTIITQAFWEKYPNNNLPEKILEVESTLNPEQITLETLSIINRFKPFGIGNPKPLWLLENITITQVRSLGVEGKHCSLQIAGNPEIKFLLWNAGEKLQTIAPGNIVSLVIELDENEWNGKKSIQAIIREIQE